MANDYIGIDANSPQGRDLIQLSRQLNQVTDLLADIVNRQSHMHDGSDYSTVETIYGIPTGKGVTVVTALAALKADLDAITGPGIAQVIARLGAG